MTNSLRDQLLKAGLVTEDKVRQANQKQYSSNKQRPKKNAKKKPDQASRDAARRQREKAERDRALNEKQKAEQQAKAAQAQIRQLLDQNKLDHSKGETPYRYTLGARIKQIYVTEEQHKQLVAGKLGITGLKARACLVPVEIAKKIREIDPNKAMYIPEKQEDKANDGYEGFEVPDDLTW